MPYLASVPGPTQLSIIFSTASDRKLSGAGYEAMPYLQMKLHFYVVVIYWLNIPESVGSLGFNSTGLTIYM